MKRLNLKNLLLFLFPAILLTMAGCSSPANPDLNDGKDDPLENIILATEGRQFVVGDSVNIELRNFFEEGIGYNFCVSDVERQDGDRWLVVATSLYDFCQTAIYTLESNESVSYTFVARNSMPSGQYRIRTPIYLNDKNDRREILSNEFLIVR